ncbi:MAG: VOC family protein [Cyclobacteriaceae bacterium]|nr:VOC family protein [Cyclobacteriaceae bacterium]
MNQNKLTPQGFSVVRPYLAVTDVDRQIDFMKNVFHAEIIERLKDPEGKTMHAELVIGDSIILVGRAGEHVKPIQGMSYVYISNADEVFERAINQGGTSIAAPVDQVYGNREGGFTDLEGNTWWIAQFMKQVPPEELEKEIARTK